MKFCNGTWILSLWIGVLLTIYGLRTASCVLAADSDHPAPDIDYPDHANLTYFRDANGQSHSIQTPAGWEQRRQHIVANLQRVMGPLPAPKKQINLDYKVIEEVRVSDQVRKKISFQSDADDRVPAYLMFPSPRYSGKRPAMLCLHQTTAVGKDEPLGIRGDTNLKYALELVDRGYVVIVPDYPTFGDHRYDFNASTGYASGSMKAIWDNIRAIDLLETLPEIDPGRIGVIGHSLGGHNAMFTAVFEPRLKVIVSSCGFTTFRKDDLPSWTGPTYMPRIAAQFGNDVKRVPFDFEEIVGSLAPRPFLACAAERDDDFNVEGVREVMESALTVYRLYGAEKHLAAYYPATPHAFPSDARQTAYRFVDQHLKP
ncbi:MAG: alpha/beta fold hydrolase [Planctomycetota bacterium]